METFTPAKAPSQDSGKKVNARIKRSDFGDGYSQRAGDGLNSIKRNYNFNWNAIGVAAAQAIEDFLEARGGHEAFLYTPPREADPRKFICTEWARGYSGGDADSITATFEEVPDL